MLLLLLTGQVPHLDERVQLLVSPNSQLQVPGSDTLHLHGRKKGNAVSGLLRGRAVLCQQRCRGGVVRTFRSLEALPASSSTSAVRYSAVQDRSRVRQCAIEVAQQRAPGERSAGS
jgi:hypothetical protein